MEEVVVKDVVGGVAKAVVRVDVERIGDVACSAVVEVSRDVDSVHGAGDVVPRPEVVDGPVVRGLTEEESWLDVVITIAGVDRGF